MAVRTIPIFRLAAAALLAAACWASAARAQSTVEGPDLRGIDPYMMLVVDTSGSMERLPACECEDAACLQCRDGRSSLPDCSLSNVSGVPPKDVNGNELKKNRWAMTLEALTGTFKDFQCKALERTQANGMSYDLSYYLDYHQPWACASSGSCNYIDPTADCNTDGDCSSAIFKYCDPDLRKCSSLGQNGDGILDQYNGAVNFGLMTYDGWDTYVGAPPLVPATEFNLTLSEGEYGLWSYGGAKRIHYPNCTTDYMMDTGARSQVADEGSLISLGSCSDAVSNCPAWCSSCPASQSTLNSDIQRSLLATRPYGGTPIAASLDDLYTHLKDDLSADDYGACRDRFALLITDGYPDDDYRSFGCDCTQNDDATAPGYCGGPEGMCNDPLTCLNHPDNMKCPYPLPEDAAAYLLNGRPLEAGGTDPPQLEKLFVVGLSVDETSAEGQEVKDRLDAIAFNGGTDNALFADDLPTLFQRLTEVMNSVIEPLSRSVPAFAAASDDAPALNGNDVVQYQVSTGFQKGFVQGGQLLPWTGIIERRAFTCKDVGGGLLEPASEPLSPVGNSESAAGGDRFHEVLNGPLGDTRDLWTVLPSDGTTSPDEHLFQGAAGDPCGSTGCSKTALSTVPISAMGAEVTTTAERDFIVDWMEGAAGTVREDRRLGDIVHSSPVVVGAPRFDIGDEAFNVFRNKNVVKNRPLVLYVGTNDGILHAFAMEDDPPDGSGLKHGEEIWGFVPPLMLDDLATQLDNHLLSMDATPVVKNVFFDRDTQAAATGDEYHTVLIMGMRSGGNSYVALDVTDPMNPVFLWQFTDIHMGLTYGQAALGQAFYSIDTGSGPEVENRAVAILPGGVGEIGGTTEASLGLCDSANTTASAKDPTSSSEFETLGSLPDGSMTIPTHRHRDLVRCWKDRGRAIYFVDVATGKLIKKLHSDNAGNRIFPSPIVSTPAIFQADVSTAMSRGFVVDADGVIWRIDMSDETQLLGDNSPTTGWRAVPFHDIFWDLAANQGQPSYEAPILSVDDAGRLVVLVGTGDTDDFEKPSAENRVVSLREFEDVGSLASPPYNIKAVFNWEKRVKSGGSLPFVASELVTGPMALFSGQLFFSTFISVGAGGDSCDLGSGRIHAVHYLERDLNDSNSTTPPTYGPVLLTDPGATAEADSIINVEAPVAIENLLLLGLSIIERPTCFNVDPIPDPYTGQSRPDITNVTDPALFLVGQGSGDSNLLAPTANSALRSLEAQLNQRRRFSRVTSWATAVD